MIVITDTDFKVPVKLFYAKMPLSLTDVSALILDMYTPDDTSTYNEYTLSDIDASGFITVESTDVSTFKNGILLYNYTGKTINDKDFSGIYQTDFYIMNDPEYHKKTCATAVSELINDAGYTTQSWVMEHAVTIEAIAGKQDTLVSGTNIKTINNQSILGAGNIDISAGIIDAYTKAQVDAKFAAEDASLRTWIENKNYLVANDVSTFTTKEYVDGSINAVKALIPDVSAFVTKSYVDESINQVRSEIPDVSAFATRQWVEDKHYLVSNDVSTFVNKEYVDGSINAVKALIPDVSAFTTKTYVDGSINQVRSEIPTVPTNVSAFTNDAGYLTQHQSLAGKQDVLVSGTNIKTINNQSILGSGNLDISTGTVDTYTKAQIDAKDASIVTWVVAQDYVDSSTFTTSQEVTSAAINSLIRDKADASTAATKTYVDGSINAVKALIPDVSAFTTKTYVDGSINLVRSEIPDVSGLASKEYVDGSINAVIAQIPTVPTNVSAFTNDAGYVDSSTLQQVEVVTAAAIAEVYEAIPTVPTNVSAFTNDAGYLTQHQSLAGKQDVLVSGTNIKTINNISLLGSGNIDISTGGLIDAYTKAESDAKYFQKTGGNITGSVDVSGNLDVHDGWMGTNATVDSSAYGFYMQITRNGSELKHITNDVTDGIIKLNHSGLFLRISGTEGSPAAGQTEYEMATKNYVDTAVGTIETALTNIIGA